MVERRRGIVLLIAIVALLGVAVLPAFAADPSSSPSGAAPASVAPSAAPAATAEPETTAAPEPTEDTGTSAKPDKGAKPDKDKSDKAPEADVTYTGTIAATTDADGATEYSMTVDGKKLVLEAGPAWFFATTTYPLAPYAGKQVTIAGEQRAGSDEVDVVSVDGKALREPGRPPWAGGWKQVGKVHPGWSQEKADRWAAKMQAKGADCWPPGHCKDKTKDAAPDADEPSGGN